MQALLGPDLGNGQPIGSKTTQNSLQPLMGLLHQHSQKTWKAGHLLNADFGGSGIWDNNLTPLTSGANKAHSTFEDHIRRMLLLCYQIDRQYPAYAEWYGVLYDVTVSAQKYAQTPSANDMHSYAYSHITLNYGFVKVPKFPLLAPPHTAPPPPNTSSPVVVAGMNADAQLNHLRAVQQPMFAPSVNIANWVGGVNAIQFSVEIHNEP
ncbi:MAG: hypothetical protein KIS62_06710 [Ramlibacter sp.]|nr:hypothetical protein [Ramlibacter sp.]